MKFSTLVRISNQRNDKHNKPTRPFHRSCIPVLKTWLLMSLEQMMEEKNWQPSSRSPSPILQFKKRTSSFFFLDFFFFFLAVSGRSHFMQHLLLRCRLSSCGAQALEHSGSTVVTHGLSYSMAYEILVLQQGSNPCPLHCKADS